LNPDSPRYCLFSLCDNRIDDLEPPVGTGQFRSVPSHWRLINGDRRPACDRSKTPPPRDPDQADEPTPILMLSVPGTPREHYVEGVAQVGDMSDEERREWFIKNGNFFIE
jgi:hypothetical protein